MMVFPIFLPHAGCPYQCVYCNQPLVTSAERATSNEQLLLTGFQRQFHFLIQNAAKRETAGELAFYGGTFTALPQEVLEELLVRASEKVAEGIFCGIRFSTRPDSLSEKTCRLLSQYPVTTVELGVQSFSDEVLSKSGRGYGADAVERAAYRIKSYGWRLGIQLMPALPGDDQDSFRSSVQRAIDLKADFVRIYPTVVLKGTLLAKWYEDGRYHPLTLKEAIVWCVHAMEMLQRAGVPIARLGLHADPQILEPGAIIAGPFHPSFGYLVKVHWWREQVNKTLHALLHDKLVHDRSRRSPTAIESGSNNFCSLSKPAVSAEISVPKRSVSEVIGPSRCNLLHWRSRWGLREVLIKGSGGLRDGELRCELKWCRF